LSRVGTVGIFTALKCLTKNNDMEGIKNVVNAVLNEAQHVKPKPKSKTTNNK